MNEGPAFRLGIDLGGTKIAGAVLDAAGQIVAEARVWAPRNDYRASVQALADMVGALEQRVGAQASIGLGMPGSLSPRTGLVQNANSTWLNGQPLQHDLEAVLGRSVRVANDANCFALSEATDGAAAGAPSVFGVILGTGCGGGLVVDGRLIDGPRSIGGEWGHNPLPWMTAEEHPGATCWCGRQGCLEIWISGTGLELDYERSTGAAVAGVEIARRADAGEGAAKAALERHANRLGRGLAHIANLFDPHVIVLGGGLSNLPHLYAQVPALASRFVFSEDGLLDIRPPRWGDASGVRGAAWLWGGPPRR